MSNYTINVGDWVTCEDGIALVIHVYPRYIEEFSIHIHKKELGSSDGIIFIGIVFCDFKGKVKSKKFIRVYTSVTKIDKKFKKILDKSILENQLRYKKFEEFFNDSERHIFLEYQVDALQVDSIKDNFSQLESELPLEFRWIDFKNLFTLEKLGFDINGFLRYGCVFPKDVAKINITVRLDSYGYKFLEKDTLFHKVNLFAT